MLTPFFGGAVRIHQPESGYRFNIDSVLLAGFAWARTNERLLDLGTGSGVLMLLLAHRHHLKSFVGVEIQQEMAALAARGVEENGWSERGTVATVDFRRQEAFEEGAFDLVVCNPPYFGAHSGRTSSDPGRAFARQGFTATLLDVLAAGGRALDRGGRFCMVWPASRSSELPSAVRAAKLHLRLRREVRPCRGEPAYLLLLQLVKEEVGKTLELPSLFVRGEGGAYTEEVAGWLGKRGPSCASFLCDAMVGKLARYLRLLGVDASYGRDAEDEWLLEEAKRTGRVLLTRDGELLARASKAGIAGWNPGSDDPARQLVSVARAFKIETGTAISAPRCLCCNAPLIILDRNGARGFVPPYTFLTHTHFSACPCCGKLTWEGSHLSRFRTDIPARLSKGVS